MFTSLVGPVYIDTFFPKKGGFLFDGTTGLDQFLAGITVFRQKINGITGFQTLAGDGNLVTFSTVFRYFHQFQPGSLLFPDFDFRVYISIMNLNSEKACRSF